MKTKIKSSCCIIVFLMFYTLMFGQQAYMRIIDKDFIPTIKHVGGKNIISVKNKDFAQCIQRYNISEFYQAFPNIKSKWLLDVYVVKFETEYELNTFISEVISDFEDFIPVVEKIQQEAILTADRYEPNDSLFQIGDLTHLELVHAPEAWNIARHYGKVKVGISDTYFHVAHQDLSYDTIYGNNVYTNSDHGTWVSSFISAITNNRVGVASTGGLNTKLIAHTIRNDNIVRYLAELGCKVINCSWFSPSGYSVISDSLYHTILYIYDCLVIFGAGNGIDHGGSLSCNLYPPSYPSCMSVTSVGHRYNYGHSGNHNWKDVHCLNVLDTTTSHHHNDAVDVCAPGYEMWGTYYWHDTAGYSCNATGTSFAAPIVTGIAAMIRAVNPSLTAVETMNIIKETADSSIYDIPENAPYIGKLGAGRVDAYQAVRKACAIDIADTIINSNTLLNGCIVTLKNTNVINSNIIIDAVVEAELISDIEIPLGCTLEIR